VESNLSPTFAHSFCLELLLVPLLLLDFFYQVGTLLQLSVVVNYAFYRDMPSSLNVLSTTISIQKKKFKN
jgi:hypothetical protein